MKNVFSDKKKIHFIGVGGISMSGLAEIFLLKGFQVSGSDTNYSPAIQKLESLGLTFLTVITPRMSTLQKSLFTLLQ